MAIGADWTKRLAEGLQHAMDVRERLPVPSEQIFDMPFREFLRDEIAVVRRIYCHFGLELSAETETRMRGYLTEHPREKDGAHRYSLAPAGLDAAEERRRYAAYRERYAIEEEAGSW